MSENNPQTCPFCSMSVAAGVTSCPNCGGLIPAGSSGVNPSSASPGGLDGGTPLPDVGGYGSSPNSGGFGSSPSGGGFGSSPSGGGLGSSPAGGFGPPPGSGGGSQPTPMSAPSFGSAPNMAPPPSKGSSAKVAIIAVIALVVVFLGVGIAGAVVWLASSSNTSYSGFSVPPQLVTVNTPISGSLSSGQSHQVYQFDLTQTGTVSIAVVGNFDNYLELYRDGTDTAIAQDDDSGGSLNALINQTLQPGTYYALVRPFSDGTTGTFTITISAPAELSGAGGGVYPTNPQMPPTNPQIPTQPPGFPNNSIPRIPSGAEIQRQTLAGTVASVSGPAPVQAGTQCTVFVEGNPRNSSLNCRIRVYCGTNILYGRDTPTNHYGYARCTVRDNPTGAQFIEAHDPTPSPTGGDPRMDIDTSAGQVSVGDEGPQGAWTVLIRFTGAPAAGTPTTSI